MVVRRDLHHLVDRLRVGKRQVLMRRRGARVLVRSARGHQHAVRTSSARAHVAAVGLHMPRTSFTIEETSSWTKAACAANAQHVDTRLRSAPAEGLYAMPLDAQGAQWEALLTSSDDCIDMLRDQ
eukprot:CAMPEP_0119408748 /NCGR_PEP_ID=MMETSP1335-20130426/2213_1 /TAXON_ID=259385 /ORGANISM="Chrysoculter rhomboideus, Strain RCC1486" /LENGTH=124 /DNA_ID=CAMNT_0007433027 /DNA_START=1 /DNA_END=373 /DNA_ORIENTATION=+